MKFIIKTALLFLFIAIGLFAKTLYDLKPISKSFNEILASAEAVQFLDRNGKPLNITYQNRWNTHAVIPIYEVPPPLKHAFIIAEDKRFYEHNGMDWKARSSALITNIKNMGAVRGASTITEQVVRMINPRPRTVWSRWLEGWEARELEKNFNKEEILEFYLNQVPYASNRRGIVQAARFYFNRDLDTLNEREMLALAVLVRSPSFLTNNLDVLNKRIDNLAERLNKNLSAKLLFENEANLSVYAPHFINYVKSRAKSFTGDIQSSKLYTSLDGNVQKKVQKILDKRLSYLPSANNGAVLVVDNHSGEILAWVVAGKQDEEIEGSFIDMVINPRQPGSALKPFVYAMALEKGWTPATVIRDAPLEEAVGRGMHSYRNYSNSFYGNISLREALGNSLNIPAVRTLQFIGLENYYNKLKAMGIESLTKSPDFYGDGLALGNGEISLFELVQAYTVLANNGVLKPLKVLPHSLNSILPDEREEEKANRSSHNKIIFSEEVASLIGNILSDPKARTLEFSENSILNLPVQTAVKTGTSTDYRDAWAVGYNYKYTVGVWIGNVNQKPMEGVSGSIGPALVLRSVFNELTKNEETKPLYLSPKLVKKEICEEGYCKTEFFMDKNAIEEKELSEVELPLALIKPTDGLHIAYDPRIPANLQTFEFYIQGVGKEYQVKWLIDGEEIITDSGKYEWKIQKGKHSLQVSIWDDNEKIYDIKEVNFLVK